MSTTARIKFAILCILRAYTEPGYAHRDETIEPCAEQRAFKTWAQAWLSGADRTEASARAVLSLVQQHRKRIYAQANPDAVALNEECVAAGIDLFTPEWTARASKYKNPIPECEQYPYGYYALSVSNRDEAIAWTVIMVLNEVIAWTALGFPEKYRVDDSSVRLSVVLDWDLNIFDMAEKALQ